MGRKVRNSFNNKIARVMDRFNCDRSAAKQLIAHQKTGRAQWSQHTNDILRKTDPRVLKRL